MELTGKLVAIGDIIEGQGARGPWQKQLFVIETTEQYPKKVAAKQCKRLSMVQRGFVATLVNKALKQAISEIKEQQKGD